MINGTVRERPILFSGPMVMAILDGRKTQTRRVIKPVPGVYRPPKVGLDMRYDLTWKSRGYTLPALVKRCPYGFPGDRLWVRELILRRGHQMVTGGLSVATYLADLTPVMGTGPDGSYCGRAVVNWKWKRNMLPSIFMPRWASRITLEVTGVRVERVQDIDRDDVIAEGIGFFWSNLGARNSSPVRVYQAHPHDDGGYPNPIEAFENLWDSINAKRGYGWDVNPWVWVVEFERV